MAARPLSDDRRLGTALGVSLLFHALLAVFIPSLQPARVSAPEALETISFQKIEHVSVRAAHVAARPRTLVAVAKASQRTARAPAARARSKEPPARQNGRPRIAQKPGTSQSQRTVIAAQSGVAAPSAAPVQAAAPAVTPRQDRAPTVAPAQGTTEAGGSGILFDVHDPTLERSIADDLRKRFKMDLTLVVVVGDDGKMKSIEFHPPPGFEMEKQIRDLLAEAHWDPAFCGGGIPCEGKATIKLSAQ